MTKNGNAAIHFVDRHMTEGRSAKTAFIEPGSPWENGYVESFNARLRKAGANTTTPSGLAAPHYAAGFRPP